MAAVVVDQGSFSTKAGFAGEDAPRGSVPTAVGIGTSPSSTLTYAVGDGVTAAHEVVNPLQMGLGASARRAPLGAQSALRAVPHTSLRSARTAIFSPHASTFPLSPPFPSFPTATCPRRHYFAVVDWPMVEHIWDEMFKTTLGVEPSAHPVVLTEVAWNTPALRERACEIMFEKYGVPAFFIGKKAVLSCYANARQTGLVVDCGHACTSAVPVFQGDVVTKGIAQSALGGLALDDHVLRMLHTQTGLPLRPHCVLGESGGGAPRRVRASHYRHRALEVARDLRERYVTLATGSGGAPLPPPNSAAARSYALPDGTAVAIPVSVHFYECTVPFHSMRLLLTI